MVIVVDADRENEGDLAIAAEKVTPRRSTSWHARPRPDLPDAHPGALRRARAPADGRGQPDALRHRVHGLDRGPRQRRPASRRPTARHDRGRLRDRPRAPRDMLRPGHVFPLRAREGGVLERAGQTEASVDLARARRPPPRRRDLRDHERRRHDGAGARPRTFCAEHGLSSCTVADLIDYRRRTRRSSAQGARRACPPPYGEFRDRLPRGRHRQGARRARARRHHGKQACWCACTPSA